MKPTAETVGVGHSYSGRVALADVVFSLSPVTTALVGVNGAGEVHPVADHRRRPEDWRATFLEQGPVDSAPAATPRPRQRP